MAEARSLVATKFFGFPPKQVYTEIYAIGHNEYLKAVSVLKETLQQEFPEKQEEVEVNCSKMLEDYYHEFDQGWFDKFINYCSRNIFSVGSNIPVYKPEMEDVDGNQQAHTKFLNLRHCIMATEYLNVELLGKIKAQDAEIERRKQLLAKAVQLEQKLEVVKRAQDIEKKIDALEHTPEM